MPGRPRRYVEGALVSGFAAHVVDRLLATYLPGYLRAMRPEQRAAVEETRVAIARAADAYLTSDISAGVSDETPGGEISASSAAEEWITTAEAAVLLGMTPRRAQQLAAGGLGIKRGRSWLLARSAVLAYRKERRSA
ncbi:helix-turn-helix domain-containing protein [Microbispora bryophytorum]|uniref:helix-turn-helix domain-containing protein n=1 Tax=Microbispora bryophytorum TaxID=1460882 RepID=UPI003723C128